MPALIAVLKIALILLWTLPLLIIQLVIFNLTKGDASYIIPRLWHKGVCKIIGITMEVVGEPVEGTQLIYVSNHLSYLDIPVIGAVLKASFVAKEDIAGWPVIGYLARIQQTAFISRSSAKAKKVAGALDDMLKAGKSLVLFPEGTSSPGTEVLPFKSSLFSLALPKEGGAIPIQPFVVDLIRVNGHTPTIAERDLYAWYADMDFAPHIWEFMQNKGATVRLTFLPVATPQADTDRKSLCRVVEDHIATHLTAPQRVSLERKDS
ncbi:MAG: lysophospholipid acyltransferase family protein [Pseudobdellovibrionaceae bacterium]